MSVQISGENKENNNEVTYSSLEEYLKMDAKVLNQLFDNEIGVKISPGTNYMISVFNPNNLQRQIYFNGAQPLHRFILNIHHFIEDYLLENNKNKIYILSILKGTSYINVSIIEGAETEAERKEKIKNMIKVCINYLDRCIAIYINEQHKKKQAYRTDTTFKELENSVNEYIKKVRPILVANM
jgi:hypothetical protein